METTNLHEISGDYCSFCGPQGAHATFKPEDVGQNPDAGSEIAPESPVEVVQPEPVN